MILLMKGVVEMSIVPLSQEQMLKELRSHESVVTGQDASMRWIKLATDPWLEGIMQLHDDFVRAMFEGSDEQSDIDATMIVVEVLRILFRMEFGMVSAADEVLLGFEKSLVNISILEQFRREGVIRAEELHFSTVFDHEAEQFVEKTLRLLKERSSRA